MKVLTENKMPQYGLLIFLSFLSVLFLFSCEETTGPGEGTTTVTRRLVIYADKSSISSNGGSTLVLVKVYAGDDTTNSVSGVKVTFSASQAGTTLYIPAQNDITDANGYARASLYAGSRSGTAAVTASIENFSNTIFVTVTVGTGLVTADPSAILADGISLSTITATVIDSLGQPLPGAPVNFTATSGTITPQSYSDQNGRAVAILKSTPSITDISSSITATTEVGKIAVVNELPERVAKSARTEKLLGTTTVIFKGVTVSGSTEKSTLFANNSDSTLVKVNMKETTSGDPLGGYRITFSSSMGQLRVSEGTTDSEGNAEVILFGANVAGTAVFTGTFAEGLEYTTQLYLIKQLFMSLESNPSVLSANGTDVSTIKAFLYDADNNPLEGETIYFSTTLGRILPSAVTDEWGEAAVSLRSSRTNGTALVTARYNTIEKKTPVEFTGAIIKILATPLVLVADGESTIRLTASLNDASGSPIVDETLSLSTSLGTLLSADMKTTGITLVDSTSTEGKLTAYLSSDVAGEAIVRFSAQGLYDSLKVHFTDYIFYLTSSKTEIYAGGDTLEITATLKDKSGTITPLTADDVEFSPTLGTIISVEDGENGSVIATLISGETAGPSTITAAIKDPPVSASTSVAFIAAEVGSLTLQSARSSVRIGGNSVDITANVVDKTGNPKSGETVMFSIIKGPGGGERLNTGTAVTNDLGQAVVSFISGMTGSTQNGVEIQGRVGTLTSSIAMTITGQPDKVVVGFKGDSFTSNSDGTYGVQITAIVSDVNRNKVVDGTIVNFSLAGDVGVIDPEVETVGGVASTMLVYSPSDAGKSVQITASSGGKQDKKPLILPGAAGTVATIDVSPKEVHILADGVTTTGFTISLTGTNGEPLSFQTVYCSTDIGKIQPSAVTGDPTDPDTAPGKTGVVYTSGALTEDQVATVEFTAGSVTQTAKVFLKGITINVTADPQTLPSDGQSKSTISVLVKETTTHIPIANQVVKFGASDGYIGGTASTDENGIARTTFTAGFDAGTTTVMATYGSTLVETIDITISEVTARGIELFASPTQIPANGISTSTISALLRDDNFNPVIGEYIRFTTTLGTITAIDSTDVNGRAEAILYSERRNGEAVVTASFKEHVSTIPVNFTGVKLNVSATPENLFAGGDETTTIAAYVKDAAEVPIVGEEVRFEWFMDGETQGVKTATTDVQGRASIVLSSDVAGRSEIRIEGAGAVETAYVTFTRMQFTIGGEKEYIETGGKTLRLWAELYDTVKDEYIEGVRVQFYTTLGSIPIPEDDTDSEGMAYADLISGNTAGTLTVSASTELDDYRVSAEKQFTFVNAGPDSINLRVDANIVGIGGNSSALIALVTDGFGNPVSDVLVSFKIIQGPAGGEYIHPATVTTGPSGIATTYFYSGQVPSDFEAVILQAEVGGKTSNEPTLTIAGAPETIKPSFLTDWNLGDIDNEDGTYTLPISATVLDINSNGVVDGTTVYFKIEPPEGAVLSPVKTQNSVAVSSITYPSASAGREVKLTASAGGKEGDITFSLPGFMVSYLALTASPKTIPADGVSTTQIKATLFDKNGSSANVPDGTTVSFTTEGGTLDPVVAKTERGVALTTLTSDKTPGVYVTVTAQSGIHSDITYVHFEEVGGSINQVSDIIVQADETIIAADGISSIQIRAFLKKFNGDPVTTPTTVVFESNIGQITNFVTSDENGIAVANFSSGTVGTATISASVGNVTGNTSVNVNPGPPRSVELSFTPEFVNVQGSGKNETLVIEASVKDSKNNPVADGNYVKFKLVGNYDEDSSISPKGETDYESSSIPTLNGRAIVSFHSGTQAGAVRVKATIVDADGIELEPLVTSETTQFLVYSGPPYLDMSDPWDPFTNSRMTIYTGPINIFTDYFGTDYNKSTIIVTVADKYNNPVPEGTAVYFTTTGGYITTSTGYTDENGVASVTLYGGNPFPTLINSDTIANPNAALGGPASFSVRKYNFNYFDPYYPNYDYQDDMENDGIAVITAYTEGLDNQGRNVTVWNYAQVVFSRAVAAFDIDVQTGIYSIKVGESLPLVITLQDINGNPVVAGSKLSISSSSAAGNLSEKSFTTDDPGQTRYYITLTNNLDPEAGEESVNTVITVKLESPNGNVTVESPPIYLDIATP